MNILITGASSYIAQYISYLFLGKGYKIYGISRQKPNIKHENYIWIKKDILKDTLEPLDVDIVIHMAAEANLGLEASIYYESNIKLTKIISEYIKKISPKVLFFSSSMKVYGEFNTNVITEETPFVNQDLYGLSKYFCEKLLEESCNTISIRLSGVIAVGSHGWIDSICQRLIKNEDIFFKNSKYNHVVHAYDIYRVIEKFIQLKKFETDSYNLCASDVTESKEIVFLMKEKLNSKSNISYEDINADNHILSNKKISEVYKPLNVIKTIELYLDEIIENNNE